MSPATEALVTAVEALAAPVTLEQVGELVELARQVRHEDPVAAAFQWAQRRFRARERA